MADDNRIKGLDGLRCYAALCVIYAHSRLGDPGWGATGVWLFFVLGGYLLAPGALSSIRSSTWQVDVPAYFIRRFARIYPAYVVAAAVYCGTVWLKLGNAYNVEMFWAHITFQMARWHFWTVKTEILFYAGLPLLMMTVAFLKGWRRLAGLAAITAGAWYLTEHERAWGFVTEPSNVDPAVFFVSPFLIGCLCGLGIPLLRKEIRDALLVIGAASLFLFSDDLFQPWREAAGIVGDNLPWRHPWMIYPFAAMVVVGAAGNESVLLNNRLAVVSGLAGYSVYLWQSFVLFEVKAYVSGSPLVTFFVSLPIIFGMALLTYLLVELPGQHIGRICANWLRRRPATA